MTGRTHLLTGMCIGLCYAGIAAPDNAIPLMIAAAAGSLLPDIDSCTSTLGRKLFPAALAIQAIFHHRTLFHAPLLYVILWILMSALFPQYQLIITACLIGIISHLALDLLNPKGIPVFYPIPKRFHLASIRTGGLVDYLLQPVLLLCFLYLWGEVM